MSADLKLEATQDLEWVIRFNRLSLKICGIWRVAKNTGWESDRFSDLRIFWYIIYAVVFASIPQTVALIRVWGHMMLMVDNLMISASFVMIEMEYFTIWYHHEVLMTMMEHIRRDWMRRKTAAERRVMLRYGNLSRIITIGGFFVISMTVVSYHTPVMFGFVLRTLTNLTDTGTRPFVLQTVYFFDAYKSPVYELIVFTHVFVGGFCGFIYTTAGTTFATIVLHVSSQLENLAARMRIMSDESDTDNFRIAFRENAKEHQRLIRFSEMIESTFSMILLQIVIGFLILVCLQGYQTIVILTEVEASPIQVIFCMTYMSYTIFLMLVFSMVGDILVTQSEEIQHAAYNCLWYRLNYREAAQLIPVFVRSQRPLTITVGKFVVLTLPTFASLLKTTAGYMSVLLAVHGS